MGSTCEASFPAPWRRCRRLGSIPQKAVSGPAVALPGRAPAGHHCDGGVRQRPSLAAKAFCPSPEQFRSGRSAAPADILRNGRSTSIGTGGRHQSECPADIIGIPSDGCINRPDTRPHLAAQPLPNQIPLAFKGVSTPGAVHTAAATWIDGLPNRVLPSVGLCRF